MLAEGVNGTQSTYHWDLQNAFFWVSSGIGVSIVLAKQLLLINGQDIFN